MPLPREIRDAIPTLQLLSEPTRLSILCLLRDAPGGEMNVTEITAAIGLTRAAVSTAIGFLRTARIIEGRRDGRFNHYSIRPGSLAAAAGLLAGLAGDGDGTAAHGGAVDRTAGGGRRRAAVVGG